MKIYHRFSIEAVNFLDFPAQRGWYALIVVKGKAKVSFCSLSILSLQAPILVGQWQCRLDNLEVWSFLRGYLEGVLKIFQASLCSHQGNKINLLAFTEGGREQNKGTTVRGSCFDDK